MVVWLDPQAQIADPSDERPCVILQLRIMVPLVPLELIPIPGPPVE